MNINIKRYELNGKYIIKCSKVIIKDGSSLYSVEVLANDEVIDGATGILSKEEANDTYLRLRDRYTHLIKQGIA